MQTNKPEGSLKVVEFAKCGWCGSIFQGTKQGVFKLYIDLWVAHVGWKDPSRSKQNGLCLGPYEVIDGLNN